MADHRPVHILIILLSFLSMVATIIFHYAATFTIRELLQIPKSWYKSNATTLYQTYKLPITPSYWTSYIWVAIFVFQVMWLGYALTLMCRTTSDKRVYLYDQGFMPIWLFVFFLLALVCHMAGVFSYDRNQQIATTFMYVLTAASLVACLVVSYVYLYRNGGELLCDDLELDVTLTRALVQNGLSMYMAWSGFNFALSLAVNLVFDNGLKPKDASTIALGLLVFFIVLYAVLDIVVRSKYMCYTFSAYLVGMAGLIGILTENYEAWERNTIMTCIVLAITLLAFGIKVAFTMWRWRTCPEPIMCSEEMKKAMANKPVVPPTPTSEQMLYPWYQPQPVYYMLPPPEMPYQQSPVIYTSPPQPMADVQTLALSPTENQVQVLNQIPSQQPVYQTIPAGGWTGWVS